MVGMVRAVMTWLRRHNGEVRVAIRATVAAVLSFALAILVDLPQPYWSVLACLLVIQATVGASLQASLDWLIGTIGGAIYGSIVGWLVPPADTVHAALALGLALAPLAFLAALNGRYRIAPITAAVALIVPRGPGVDAIAFTIDRTSEIGLGAIVAVAVSLVVLPSRAHGMLAESAGRVLHEIAELLPRLVSTTKGRRPEDNELLEVFSRIRERMARLDGAATEARRERQIRLNEDPDPAALVMAVVRVRNDAIMIFRATGRPLPEPIGTRLAPLVQGVADAAASHLAKLATAFGSRSAPPEPTEVRNALAAYDAEVGRMRAEGLFVALPTDEVEQLFSLGFALDQILQDLNHLGVCCAQYARSPVPPAAATSAA